MKHLYFILLVLVTVACSNNLSNVSSNKLDNLQQVNIVAKSDYKQRLNFGAKLEPEFGIIHGAGQDIDSYNRYSDLMPNNSKPLMYMTYVSLTQSTDEVINWHKKVKAEITAMKDTNVVLQIGVNLTSGKDNGSGEAERLSQGEFDEQIKHFINALADLNTPTYLRIGYEFEGKWNNYTPEGFIGAFRLITEKVRSSKIKNIATVWCSAGGSAGFISKEALMNYYPGDDVVDWWGVDIFSPQEITNPWLGEFYRDAQKHGKPVMIGETTPRYVGVDDGIKSWMDWYQPFFDMIKEYPQIKAISYINWDWNFWSNELGFSWHNWKDARLEKNSVVSDKYIQEIADPVWLHADDFRFVPLEN
ncbi:glycoside hydrolase family 26 protein [Pseudocolwellia sp. HL-MZ7]|uniref:glycoside hydrolase family 26 protein n=1 Tax=Pseudocolwellia sp. HL-MZ7 TaxID=3400627 RepID=UPI003CF8428A